MLPHMLASKCVTLTSVTVQVLATNCWAYYSIVLIAQLAVQVHAIALALIWQLA